jgi:hypothetical protein
MLIVFSIAEEAYSIEIEQYHLNPSSLETDGAKPNPYLSSAIVRCRSGNTKPIGEITIAKLQLHYGQSESLKMSKQLKR